MAGKEGGRGAGDDVDDVIHGVSARMPAFLPDTCGGPVRGRVVTDGQVGDGRVHGDVPAFACGARLEQVGFGFEFGGHDAPDAETVGIEAFDDGGALIGVEFDEFEAGVAVVDFAGEPVACGGRAFIGGELVGSPVAVAHRHGDGLVDEEGDAPVGVQPVEFRVRMFRVGVVEVADQPFGVQRVVDRVEVHDLAGRFVLDLLGVAVFEFHAVRLCQWPPLTCSRKHRLGLTCLSPTPVRV